MARGQATTGALDAAEQDAANDSARAPSSALIGDEVTSEAVVRRAIGEIVESAERLRALADLIEDFGATPCNAEASELRRAVVGIHAVAVQVVSVGTGALGASERLAAVAELRDGH